ncbi:hypothetical protein JTE90_010664 [Oedothorax gibbosus]|uniref:Uncharacterized protein n=1 Tax=Oedothorax gibbosus TaxID=931172 RepID=A0AAV6UT52_9ARAC|nr:hypothetical protein JTE90_010664 [Oedothorax gibbosus]
MNPCGRHASTKPNEPFVIQQEITPPLETEFMALVTPEPFHGTVIRADRGRGGIHHWKGEGSFSVSVCLVLLLLCRSETATGWLLCKAKRCCLSICFDTKEYL